MDINEVAKLLNRHPQTISKYIRMFSLKIKKNSLGHKVFDNNDLVKLKEIKETLQLKDLRKNKMGKDNKKFADDDICNRLFGMTANQMIKDELSELKVKSVEFELDKIEEKEGRTQVFFKAKVEAVKVQGVKAVKVSGVIK